MTTKSQTPHEIASEVIMIIGESPRSFDMTKWGAMRSFLCDTSCCIAGHVFWHEVKMKRAKQGDCLHDIAREALRLSKRQENQMFWPENGIDIDCDLSDISAQWAINMLQYWIETGEVDWIATRPAHPQPS